MYRIYEFTIKMCIIYFILSHGSLYSKIRSYMKVASSRAVCLICDLINRKMYVIKQCRRRSDDFWPKPSLSNPNCWMSGLKRQSIYVYITNANADAGVTRAPPIFQICELQISYKNHIMWRVNRKYRTMVGNEYIEHYFINKYVMVIWHS